MVLAECVFDANHKAPDAAIFQQASGKLGYNCFHQSCAGKGWRDVREKFEPGYRDQQSQSHGKSRSQGATGKPTREPLKRVSASELHRRHRKTGMKPPLINGLLRVGETMNLVSDPKVGKSWLALGLSLSICAGKTWMGRGVRQGRVLYIDNELHEETIEDRIHTVAKKLDIAQSVYGDRLDFLPLRGNLKSVDSLALEFAEIERDEYSVVVIDAIYRAIPDGMEENSNETWKHINNQIDQYAKQLNAAFVEIHHATKGSQSDKKVTDVGAGGGAQSRAADCHLIIREHQEKGAFGVHAAVRSFPPPSPFAVRWEWPEWYLDDELDPELLKQPKRRGRGKATAKTPKPEPWTYDQFKASVLGEKPQSLDEIKAAMEDFQDHGLSMRAAERYVTRAEGCGDIHRWRFGSNSKHKFATKEQPELVDTKPVKRKRKAKR